MEARILELIKNPEIISAEDILTLEKHSDAMPYAQVFRALRLKAAHLHSPEKYPKILSETAAYTTDKKILYQLINGKSEKFQEEIPMVAAEEKPSISTESKFEKLPEITPAELPKPVYINGELNRILFEGEENFMNEEAPKIDLEQTKESGRISVFTEPKSQPEETETLKVGEESLSKTLPLEETESSLIQENTQLPVEETESSDESFTEEDTEINIYQSEEFIPTVFQAPKHENFAPPAQSQAKQSNADLEMQRLIAEVEAKMKKNKKTQPEKETEELVSGEINFAETQSFEVNTPQPSEDKKETTEGNTGWKPMNFSGQTPDAKINSQKNETLSEESQTENIDLKEDFKAVEDPAENTAFTEKSNIPSFINTWQSWLKISPKNEETPSDEKFITENQTVDKVQPEEEAPKPEKKEQIIENFIENNPKISKLKEDAQFTIREKDDDISHLMTETLAKLYLEQRLYSKAINAYEILIKKFPERKKEFSRRISEIKDMRPGK